MSAPILSSLSTVRIIVGGLLRKALHGVEAVENFAVVHADLEALQAQGGEGTVDNGGDLRLVEDSPELSVADHIDIRLIEFAGNALAERRSPR